jgi:murein DD-endopeptidase MepM/ murein hydrolase activator NlpD
VLSSRRSTALCALTLAALVSGPAAATASDGGAAFGGSSPAVHVQLDARTGGATDGSVSPRPVRRVVRPRPRRRVVHHRRPTRPVHHPAPVHHTATTGIFPVAGPHSFGGADLRFGAARTGHVHQGQDVIAAEGTRLVSPARGTVIYRASQRAGAGNYLVIHGDDGRDYVFMHLRHPSPLASGERVSRGETVGMVGHTGDAQGPHLHFEIWVHGWYARGGHPVDPLPFLRRWDR